MNVQLYADGDAHIFLGRSNDVAHRISIPADAPHRMKWAVHLALKAIDKRIGRQGPWYERDWGWEASFHPNPKSFPSGRHSE